jgi:ferredoxin-NADP reductase
MKDLILQGQRALDLIDRFLDRLTSYRLVLYSLIAFVSWAIFASLIDEVSFEWYEILGSAAWLVAVCFGVNLVASKFFNIPRNKESDLISALILALILLPAQEVNDYLILAVAGSVAMLSKYFLVFSKRHIFNPAALGAFSVGLLFDYYPAWWVGTIFLVPLVFVAGQLILRKMKRYWMVSVFMGVYLGYLIFNYFNKDLSGGLFDVIWIGLTATPVLFFAYIMLTEPSTSPHKLPQMLIYAATVGILYSVTSLGYAPEEALLIGNLLAFVMAPNRRLELALVQRQQEAKDIYSYIFSGKKNLQFAAGQYMEWTLPAAKTDRRGNRRYFTVSAAPTEENLMFTVKEPTPRSSFKTGLDELKEGDKMLAYQLEGSFTLPKDASQKLAFLAGGIGVTPFRSIIKYLLDTKQKRDITMLYSANNAEEFAFTNLFNKAEPAGITTHHLLRQIDSRVIKKAIPDYKDRLFYISGPYAFVTAMRQTLLKMGVPRNKIVSDYFPGYG